MSDLELYKANIRTPTAYKIPYISVVSIDMTSRRAENICRLQPSTELIGRPENTLDCFTWPFYMGFQSFDSRIETEAKLDP